MQPRFRIKYILATYCKASEQVKFCNLFFSNSFLMIVLPLPEAHAWYPYY